MHSNMLNAAVLLALCTSSMGYNIFDDIYGDHPDCDGVSIQGYCCPGSVLSDGEFSNNNNNDPSGLTCCVGDPSKSFNNGPESCSAGTPTPLTAVSSGGSAAATASMTDGMSSASASMAMTSAASTGSVDMMDSMTTMTSSATMSSTTEDADVAEANTASESSSSTSSGGAARAMVTGAPCLAGAVVGALALL